MHSCIIHQEFFRKAGLGENSAFLSSIGIGVTNLIFTIIGISLIDKVGEKY